MNMDPGHMQTSYIIIVCSPKHVALELLFIYSFVDTYYASVHVLFVVF